MKPDGKVTVAGPGGKESASQAQQEECVTERSPGISGTKRVTSRGWHRWASWNGEESCARAAARPCQAETNSSKGRRLGHSSEPSLKAASIHPGTGTNQSMIRGN